METAKQVFQLSLQLAKAGFKMRNEGSYLGILWYLLNPLLLFVLLVAVFSTRLGQDIPNYPLYLLLGIIMFNFFQQATIESTRVINDHRWSIKSINFQREALVGSVVLKALFSHAFEMVLFLLLLIIFKVSPMGMLFYPFILFLLAIFSLGVSFLLSSLTAYFADLENIWFFASRVLWLATPIFYAVEKQSPFFVINLFNPLYYFITAARELLLSGQIPEFWVTAGALLFPLFALGAGLAIYNKLKSRFAEML
jgi:ABC-2 type transport system permease protein